MKKSTVTGYEDLKSINGLEGKIAVITGGTQGLGAATARRLASLGTEGIILAGRNVEKGNAVASSIQNANAQFVKTDLANTNDCKNLIAEAISQFGRIDVLVNAGATTARGTILDTDEELFDEIFATNVRGPFFLMQETIRSMIDQGVHGNIINIGSASSRAGQSFISPYCAAKGALATLTRNVAWSVASYGINVNGINIGWMKSDQEVALHASQGHDQTWFDEIAQTLPNGRLIEPDEVANLIAFLASDCSGLMNGEMINFDQFIWGAHDQNPSLPNQLT